MICPNCQTNNRADSRFCKSCGTPLSQITSPELPPMMPEEQSFQAQQRPVDAYKTEEHFQVGTSIAFQADIPSAGVPQCSATVRSVEWTAMPPPCTFCFCFTPNIAFIINNNRMLIHPKHRR